MRRSIIMTGILLLLPWAATATPAVPQAIANAEIVGKGRLSIAFWDVYDATLYAPQGKWSPEDTYALSIHYFREINGKDIADRSVQEMRKQGFPDEVKLAAWNTQMKSIFPDVKNGSVLTAVFYPGKETVFFDGEKKIGIIKGGDFAQHFSDIWLSEKTSEPELRQELLGSL